jgi:hypothetical protein
MAAALSVLTRVEILRHGPCFGSPLSDSDIVEGRRPLPLTRSALPALRWLGLEGDGEYLDGFVAQVDVPSINYLGISLTAWVRSFFAVDLFHGLCSNQTWLYDINVTVSMQTLTPSCGVLQLDVLYSSDYSDGDNFKRCVRLLYTNVTSRHAAMTSHLGSSAHLIHIL